MAWGLWNVKLGGYARKNYTETQYEKMTIYGPDIVDSAWNYVTACCYEMTQNSDNVDWQIWQLSVE